MDRRRFRNPPPHPLVLLVEGHEDTRELYVPALTASGFDVVAANGADACRRAWEMHPDIIVTDLPPPPYIGWQFLQDLKRNPRTRDIPVVAVSGCDQPALHERAIRDGFAAVFPKTCLPHQLGEGLRQLLEGRPDAAASR